MKVAIATENNQVSCHFGHCEGFTILNLEDNKICNKQFVKNPGHKPGYLPVFLKENNVNIIIAGGMGQRAQELFNQNSIEVIVGATGSCDHVADEFLRGELKSTGSVCKEHEHEGDCNE